MAHTIYGNKKKGFQVSKNIIFFCCIYINVFLTQTDFYENDHQKYYNLYNYYIIIPGLFPKLSYNQDAFLSSLESVQLVEMNTWDSVSE